MAMKPPGSHYTVVLSGGNSIFPPPRHQGLGVLITKLFLGAPGVLVVEDVILYCSTFYMNLVAALQEG
jgi:hypothetical protein